MRETWYVLEDGNVANPRECELDKNGVLNHKGVPVAMRGDAYSSRGVDLDDADETSGKAAKNREVKAGKAKAYKTR